ARRTPAAVLGHPALLRRLTRPLGGRHARRRGDELPDEHGQLPRGGWSAAAHGALPPCRREHRPLRSDRARSDDVLAAVDGDAQPEVVLAGGRVRVRVPRRQLRDAEYPERRARGGKDAEVGVAFRRPPGPPKGGHYRETMAE